MNHHQKGSQVNHGHHRAKTTSESKTGFFAVLSDLLRGGGSGAGFLGGTAVLQYIKRASSAPVIRRASSALGRAHSSHPEALRSTFRVRAPLPHSSHPEALRLDSRVRGRFGLLALTIAAFGVTAFFILAALFPTFASAKQIHVFKESFGTEGTGAGQISEEAQGIAVDNEGFSIQSISSAPAQARPSHPEALRPLINARLRFAGAENIRLRLLAHLRLAARVRGCS